MPSHLYARKKAKKDEHRPAAFPQEGDSPESSLSPPTVQFNTSNASPIQRKGLTKDEAKNKIRKAGKGWGTDESGIYSAIRSCEDREGLKNDKEVQQILQDELSGHDLWKAQLLLEFGHEANFPAPIQEIWGATKGWGTDESRIYKALQKLDAREAVRIGRIPGVRDILKEELSGKDLSAANDLLGGQYAGAIERHKQNVSYMMSLLEKMKTGPLIQQNTAEWLNPARAGGAKNNLHVCTKTHDAAARAKHHGHKADMAAYFGAKEIVPGEGSYDAHIDSTRNIRFVQQGTGGHHLGKDIWIYEPLGPGMGEFTINVLVHEVQHDADRHDKEEGHDHSFGSPEESWNRYKTEFRSYWMDGRFEAGFSDAPDPSLAPFDNARQKRIFDLMRGASKEASLYPWIYEAYKDGVKVDGKEFKDLIHGYARPEGINLYNSPRIDDFFQALDGCSPKDNEKSPSIQKLMATIPLLDYQDTTYILDGKESERLRKMIETNLSPAMRLKVLERIRFNTAGDFPMPKGDTMFA